MSIGRTLAAMICAFVVTWVGDFLIHGVWLAADYGASMSLWRPEADMPSHMPWLMVGQLMTAVTMTLIYVRGFAARRCLSEACLFGSLMGLFGQAMTPILFAVQPLPAALAVKWVVAGTVQGLVAGLVLYAVCRPRATESA